jgi:hypothetical protein
MPTESDLLNVEQALNELIAPLRERATALEAVIEKKQSELAALQAARRRVMKTLATLDPEMPAPGRKPGSAASQNKVVAPETLERVTAWLREHQKEINGNGGFSAPTLVTQFGFDVVSRATLTHALKELHADGVLRLDHRGMGGAKFYKMVG